MKAGVVLILLTLCLTVSMADAGWSYSVFRDGVLTVEQWWQPFYDVYPTPIDSYGFSDLVLVDGGFWRLGSPDRHGNTGVDHIQIGPVGGEMSYRLVEGSPRTMGEHCDTMVYWGGEFLVCSGGALIAYRPGDEKARYLGVVERPLADLTVFGGDLYGLVEAENLEEDPWLVVRLDFDGAGLRVAEELPITVRKGEYYLGFIAADETGFWVYDDFLLGSVHVLPDGTRDRWLPMPDSGLYLPYILEDGALEADWDPTMIRFHGMLRGESRGQAAIWHSDELFIKCRNQYFIWVLDLDSAPVLDVPERWLVVTADGLNLRAGPGTRFVKVRLLTKWDQVLVCDETTVGDDTWYRVVTFAGETGWLCAGQGGESWVIVYPPGEAPRLSAPFE